MKDGAERSCCSASVLQALPSSPSARRFPEYPEDHGIPIYHNDLNVPPTGDNKRKSETELSNQKSGESLIHKECIVTVKHSQDKLEILSKDFEELETLFDIVYIDLHGIFKWMFYNYNNKDQRKNINEIDDIQNFFKTSRDRLYTFRRLRLYQIGAIDTIDTNFSLLVELFEGKKFDNNIHEIINPEQYDSSMENYLWESAGKLCANEIKQKILDYRVKFHGLRLEKEFPIPIKNVFVCLFKMIDVLFRNEFITEETLRTIQEPEIHRLASLYNIDYIKAKSL
ncbi:uncharacterized protein PGTG_03336 [Puccinia graminis f. sp. tritici CRL 75-36-700-3]|uniref:Uncharacterized protein n=1 Tax=Puccinia graminis f. sp. tritici (strain CRL 75-36-700-3 / race SCCL) TaxID=418459 RepID=E3JZA5_PUCGT|nr:uncharacterized protein PGTG_03336 [Puccinia graminis f. sp. tritici CRL 75-36-700-3]EFP77380.2 hypothetical protein PGTG_03336 [Puccinia graminis f. sp. tritici CRL 75-36-700-3]